MSNNDLKVAAGAMLGGTAATSSAVAAIGGPLVVPIGYAIYKLFSD